ncbi:GntR family transcriptional regulator [Rhodococcus sp. TAF43]|uniref:GntR family transcriptional regulator n=1 Tax=unclassified Rhodococcus (in: high G+C Gram-positive bacteria) TaxID=192944 RepID=UPI0015815DDD|nr:GntR family transcriptional regulator [Rhodococcus sp. W8901]QKT09723.1 GntR family transcriptional regulator [Rhodococcus sp. W8901]
MTVVARYEEVARSLSQRIEDGSYPVGSKLPTEVNLADSYAVSRATVRSALDSLERLGMVSRRRKIGTLVESAQPTSGYTRTVTNMNDLVQYSVETRRLVLSRDEVVADQALADRIGGHAGDAWTLIRMLRLGELGEELPVCHTDVYLDPEVAAIVGDRLERPDGLINEIVERCTGRLTDRVEQRIRACALPKGLAAQLKAEAGSPCLEITRRYVESSGAVAQVTVSIHPGDRFDFNVPMQRQR